MGWTPTGYCVIAGTLAGATKRNARATFRAYHEADISARPGKAMLMETLENNGVNEPPIILQTVLLYRSVAFNITCTLRVSGMNIA